MGLETFAFIPDLVATNPEPTDPVAQGDDHIRGLKFTLQNQWPNIGEDQVDRTALQMNDAALRSEQNIFSANLNEFTDSALRITQSADTESGKLLFIAEDAVQRWNIGRGPSASAGNFELRRFDSGGNLLDAPISVDSALGNIDYSGRQRGPNGTTGNPTWSWTSDPTTGMFRDTAGRVSFTSIGQLTAIIDQTQVQALGSFRGANGSEATPSYGFTGSTDAGMFRVSSTAIAFPVGGVTRFQLATNIATFRVPLRAVSGTAAAPGYAFETVSDMGLQAFSTSIMAIATGGVERARISSTQWETSVPTTTQNEGSCHRNVNTQARTGWRFTDASNNPMWSIYLGTDPNNTLAFQRYNSSGTFQDIPLSIRQLNGLIRMSTLPTSSAGLISGELWRNPVSPGFVAIV